MNINPKLFSMRVWWSVAGIVVFVLLSLTGWLPVEFVCGILSTLVYAYFTRSDRAGTK